MVKDSNRHLLRDGSTRWSRGEVTQSCSTLCDPMDYSLPGSSIQGIFQARILEWAATSFSRGFSWPRDGTQVSHTVGRHFTIWATREAWNSCQNYRGKTIQILCLPRYRYTHTRALISFLSFARFAYYSFHHQYLLFFICQYYISEKEIDNKSINIYMSSDKR